MQRYFIKNNYRQNDIIIADDSMYKHMTKVMRMEKGEHVICIDEDKHVFLCEIIDLKQGLLQIKEELQENNELDVEVTLVYGLPKSDKFEFVIQKATELGVTRIVPLRASRSIVSALFVLLRKQVNNVIDRLFLKLRRLFNYHSLKIIYLKLMLWHMKKKARMVNIMLSRKHLMHFILLLLLL